jgi:hypothetical protein
VIQATSDITDQSFEPGTGGFASQDSFEQLGVSVDVGLREFRTPSSSWEAQVVLGYGSAAEDEISDDIDDTGARAARFVTTNYDISDLRIGVYGGYNRLKMARLGETEFRAGLERTTRELSNTDLSYSESGGAVTPELTLVGQSPITHTHVALSARSIFQAGATEMFAGAELGYGITDGTTQIDAGGTVVSESIDDAESELGLTVGLRQPFFRDKLRFIISGHADLSQGERTTYYDAAADGGDTSLSTAQYAIGLEGALANVTFDVAWLAGDEAPVVPVELGLPSGSRRGVELDRLVFSAAVSW